MQVVDANGNMFGYDHLEIIGPDGKPKTIGGGGGPYVPYTGATGNVDLGEYELKAGQLTLDISPTGTATVGTTRWNNSIGSSETTLKGGTVILKNGVDLVTRVVNKVTPNTTLTRANYTAVRVSGAQGQRLAVAYAQANTDNNSADTIGLVIETIPTNQEGFIMTVGQLLDVNTTGSLQGETWADGDVLYLSPTTAGLLTNIKPTGLTGHIVVMGYVEYAHAIHGSIYVKIMNGWELDELHNVYINPSTLANNDLLQYDSATFLWKNRSLSAAGIQPALGYTPVPTTRTISTTSPLSGGGDLSANRTLAISQANSITNGYLSSTDWSTFNGKQDFIVAGTTAQYWRGDKTWQTFPTIPTVTPSALTKVDDTNVTLTLGGSPSTALLQATSLTLGWTGTLADSRIASAATWNAKQNAITLTTTGTSGAATLVGSTLNIPQYGGGTGLTGIHALMPLASGDKTSYSVTSQTTASNGTYSGNRIHAAPFIPNQTFTCSDLYINVTTLAAGALGRIAIYSNSGQLPNSLLYLSADLDLSTTGVKTAVTSFTFTAGTTYWICFHSSTVSASIGLLLQNFMMPLKNATAGTGSVVNYVYSNTTFTSGTPSTFTSPLLGAGSIPFIGITKA